MELNKHLNKKFGMLKIIRFTNAPKNTKNKLAKYHKWVFCSCDCGKTKTTILSQIINGGIKSCGCNKHPHGENSKCFSGYKEISGKFFAQIKRTANGGTNKRKRVCKNFSITIKYLWELYLKQNKKCALTGLPLHFNSRSEKNDGNISLDRVNSTKGYEKGNVQWVHKDINIMKNEFPQNDFIKYCTLVVDNFKKKD